VRQTAPAFSMAAARSSEAWIAHQPCRSDTQDVAVKMDDAALPLRLRIELSQRLHQTHAGVGDEKPDPFQSPFLQMTQKVRPACLVLFGFLADPRYPAISVPIHPDGATRTDTLLTSPDHRLGPTMPSPPSKMCSTETKIMMPDRKSLTRISFLRPISVISGKHSIVLLNMDG